ncbi:TetR family transcriptional regulator C-terminal domain-containing protein [Amycolatopsis nigrescens]|uniref:TetR family transcriptional regulator C-terminal domain-containing protein n=1 Tax=Amycolatopsis nigrescens TaxID=381445 RepID=UPI000476FC68|nr:TetR family transcriptional regulator C-terminal domain-containing protein [Amycolatopsis nigrescens]
MTGRADARKDAMEQAGVQILAESGWPAVTARAIADRSGANPGLIHYYYGGLPGLHRAIAARAIAMTVRPAVETVLAADDVAGGMLDVLTAPGESTSTAGRLTTELAGAAFRDDTIRQLLRDEFRAARDELARKIVAERPHWPSPRATGAATLVTALLDGLLLHRLLDDELDLDTATEALRTILSGA